MYLRLIPDDDACATQEPSSQHTLMLAGVCLHDDELVMTWISFQSQIAETAGDSGAHKTAPQAADVSITAQEVPCTCIGLAQVCAETHTHSRCQVMVSDLHSLLLPMPVVKACTSALTKSPGPTVLLGWRRCTGRLPESPVLPVVVCYRRLMLVFMGMAATSPARHTAPAPA
jgi:hypothetical protein